MLSVSSLVLTQEGEMGCWGPWVSILTHECVFCDRQDQGLAIFLQGLLGPWLENYDCQSLVGRLNKNHSDVFE